MSRSTPEVLAATVAVNMARDAEEDAWVAYVDSGRSEALAGAYDLACTETDQAVAVWRAEISK